MNFVLLIVNSFKKKIFSDNIKKYYFNEEIKKFSSYIVFLGKI